MSLISALSYQEPGIPRFLWSPDYHVVSIDGFPLQLSKLVNGIHAIVSQAEVALEKVLRGCPLQDCWRHIDLSLDPSKPSQWFTDKSREDCNGYSFLTDPTNGLVPYQHHLLKHLLRQGSNEFVLDLQDNHQHIRKGPLFSPISSICF